MKQIFSLLTVAAVCAAIWNHSQEPVSVLRDRVEKTLLSATARQKIGSILVISVNHPRSTITEVKFNMGGDSFTLISTPAQFGVGNTYHPPMHIDTNRDGTADQYKNQSSEEFQLRNLEYLQLLGRIDSALSEK